jgi:hypothetical protein
MPKSRITKTTEQILTIKRKVTKLSNPKLIEFAVINMPDIEIKKRK